METSGENNQGKRRLETSQFNDKMMTDACEIRNLLTNTE